MDQDRYDRGLAVRREVLGSEYVDKSIQGADDFTRPLQEYVTESAWGAIWTRPGLSRKTRSLLNLAMLTALNRPHEIQAAHQRRAQQQRHQDRSRSYCGVPASIDSACARVFGNRASPDDGGGGPVGFVGLVMGLPMVRHLWAPAIAWPWPTMIRRGSSPSRARRRRPAGLPGRMGTTCPVVVTMLPATDRRQVFGRAGASTARSPA
jgi:4-carboxymuconolactone decarboxylase